MRPATHNKAFSYEVHSYYEIPSQNISVEQAMHSSLVVETYKPISQFCNKPSTHFKPGQTLSICDPSQSLSLGQIPQN